MSQQIKLPHYPMYIDGEFITSSKIKLRSINPHNGKPWATFANSEPKEIERAIMAARQSLHQGEWTDMLPTERGKLLFKLADLIEEHAALIGEIETNDSGKLLAETATQTKYVADYYRYFAGLADKIEGATLPIDKPDMHVLLRMSLLVLSQQ